jgi:archaemetzincin
MDTASSHIIKASVLWAALAVLPQAGSPVTSESPKLDAIRAAANKIRPLHTKMGPPQPGDWLVSHKESGQTFDQYLKSNPNRPGKTLTTIYIQPLGEFDPTQQQLIEQTADLLGRFYGVPVKTLDKIGLEVIPAKARRVHPSWGDKQILTTHVLYDLLKPRRPRDAVAVLALTTSDLWPGEGWNFVFGQADLNQRVGVWSLYRNGDPHESNDTYRLCLLRTLKTATHETGHMLGIQHCTAYECGMCGSNNRPESDRRPLAFCPECEPKVWWACGADPAKRYESLAESAEKQGLDDEAQIWKRSLEAIQSK